MNPEPGTRSCFYRNRVCLRKNYRDEHSESFVKLYRDGICLRKGIDGIRSFMPEYFLAGNVLFYLDKKHKSRFDKPTCML